MEITGKMGLHKGVTWLSAFILVMTFGTLLGSSSLYAQVGSCSINVANGDVAGLIAAINTVERDLRGRFPQVRFCFFEPDVEDGDSPAG